MIDALSIIILIYLTGNNSLVLMNITITQPTPLINITLPTQPLGPITVMNSTGQSIPYYISNNELYIPMPTPGNITIEYTPYIAILNNGTLQLTINTQYQTQLYISNNVLPTTIPDNMINFQESNNGMLMTLPPGNYAINFIITNQHANIPQTKSQTTNNVGRHSMIPWSILNYAVIIIIAALIIVILSLIRHRR